MFMPVTDQISRNAEPLLQVRNLSVSIPRFGSTVHAVRDVSLKIGKGERVAILGESGSGKTMTALTLVGLQPSHARLAGTVTLADRTFGLAEPGYGVHARRHAAVVFQDSLSALNPIARIGTQLMEVLVLRGRSKRAAHEEAVMTLDKVGVPDARRRMDSYPHELSGGMRQRVMICMALLAKPSLLIADEPTTALDTTVQAQVIDLILELQAETNMGMMLITHDLAMAAEVCDRAVLMYAGYVVEDLPMADLRDLTRHPYTRALHGAMPRLNQPRDQELEAIDGEPPPGTTLFDACPFLPRCRSADDACRNGVPPLEKVGEAHHVRCTHQGRHGRGLWASAEVAE